MYKQIVVVLVTIIALAHCHNWVKTPPVRNGNVAEQSTPCDTSKINATYLVDAGSSVPLTWTQNHNTGTYSVYLVPADQESTLESQTTPVGSWSYSVGSASISVPATATGHYVLQWRWETWRNCIDLYVSKASATDTSKTTSSISSAEKTVSTSMSSPGGKSFSVAMVVIGAICVAAIVAGLLFLKFKKPESFAQLKQDIIT